MADWFGKTPSAPDANVDTPGSRASPASVQPTHATHDDDTITEHIVKTTLDRSRIGKAISRWISLGEGNLLAVRCNYVVFALATLLTWAFAIICFADDNATSYFAFGKSWIAQNFTWLYMSTQDAWAIFLIFLCFSRFANVKLGRDDEKPRFDDWTWFCMLFTCGVAVGLFVFGTSEPLYFYRLTTGTYASLDKTTVDSTDAQRAQQAIFMAVFHWGLHGWVPYILLALSLGLASFRWNLPLTIRSAFVPLLGDHALGLTGDFIDSMSIATTTFGVCTSLGLGVSQLSEGLQYLKKLTCSVHTNCIDAGGSWSIASHGPNNCFNVPDPAAITASCDAPWLLDAHTRNQSYYVIIALITIAATFSVITGLDRGIKYLSQAAFGCGSVVLLALLYGDNTWYLLNVMTQTVGFYFQWIIQVGLDCMAFEQLNFEWRGPGTNVLWGTDGESSSLSVVTRAGLAANLADSADCGMKINPCSMGFVALATVQALNNYFADSNDLIGKGAYDLLRADGMSRTDLQNLAFQYQALSGLPNLVAGVPCGSGWNTTHYDDFTKEIFSPHPVVGTELEVAWSIHSTWPKCPADTYGNTAEWGACATYEITCPKTRSFFNDADENFLQWWTIFYWAWWITWAPFVGFFVALISRGRTVREVIIGGFFAPTLFAIIWFSVFGGLAIKMERVAEMALNAKPDVASGTVSCAEHYASGTPVSPDAKALAVQGYYMLSCLGGNDQIYKLVEPYWGITGVLQIALWFSLVIYFLTSSDSGSMTDDIISASGLSATYIPIWQKVWWCFTEGVVAIALIATGGRLRALQHVSIIMGMPYTVLLCFLVPATYRLLKHDMGDADILESKRFNTQLLDITEFFTPRVKTPIPGTNAFLTLCIAALVPGIGLHKAMLHTKPEKKATAMAYAIVSQLLYLGWFVLQLTEIDSVRFAFSSTLGWVLFTFFLAIVASTRIAMRTKYNIWGSALEDLWVSLCYPFAIAQMQHQAETDGVNSPGYFEHIDDLVSELTKIKTFKYAATATSTDAKV